MTNVYQSNLIENVKLSKNASSDVDITVIKNVFIEFNYISNSIKGELNK